MKQIIKDVLEDMSRGQHNLASDAARELVATTISAALKTYGEYTKYKLDTSGEPVKPINSYLTTDLPREDWVCDYCGKSTHDVEYEYLVSQTRHLECQLKYERENGEHYTEDISTMTGHDHGMVWGHDQGESYEKDDVDLDWPEERDNIISNVMKENNSDDSDANVEFRNKIFDLQKQAYMEYSSDGLPEGGDRQAVLDAHKLADEIGDAHEGDWIYESPDGGKTVFRRPFSDYDPENKEEIDWETKEPTGRKFTEYNNGNWRSEDEG